MTRSAASVRFRRRTRVVIDAIVRVQKVLVGGSGQSTAASVPPPAAAVSASPQIVEQICAEAASKNVVDDEVSRRAEYNENVGDLENVGNGVGTRSAGVVRMQRKPNNLQNNQKFSGSRVQFDRLHHACL